MLLPEAELLGWVTNSKQWIKAKIYLGAQVDHGAGVYLIRTEWWVSVYMCVYGTGVCGVCVSAKCVCVRGVRVCVWSVCLWSAWCICLCVSVWCVYTLLCLLKGEAGGQGIGKAFWRQWCLSSRCIQFQSGFLPHTPLKGVLHVFVTTKPHACFFVFTLFTPLNPHLSQRHLLHLDT